MTRFFLIMFLLLLQAQDDYISQLHVKFNDLQRYAVSTEEVMCFMFTTVIITRKYFMKLNNLKYIFPVIFHLKGVPCKVFTFHHTVR